ncbi:MAG: hypothetical protein OEU92_15295 [Alphaproteobacteria bacterium]|nr:hypothetical protein [Alphaproteobacteria bacterium]
MVEGMLLVSRNHWIETPAYLIDKTIDFALSAPLSRYPGLVLGLSGDKVIRRTKKQR